MFSLLLRKHFADSLAIWAFEVHPRAERRLWMLNWIHVSQGGINLQKWLLLLSFIFSLILILIFSKSLRWGSKSKASKLKQMEPRSKLSLFFGNAEQTRFWGGKNPKEPNKKIYGCYRFLSQHEPVRSPAVSLKGEKLREYKEKKCLKNDIFGSFAKENVMYE